MGDTSSKLKPVGSKDFQAEVLSAPEAVLVDFWAPWCGPCRAVTPVLEELSGAFAGKAKFLSLNVDDNQDLAVRYGVMGIPTVIVFKGGQVSGQLIGAQNKRAYESLVNNALK